MPQRFRQHHFRAMGGPCEISVWVSDGDDVNELFKVLEQEVRRLESKYSRFRDDSLVSRLSTGELNGVDLDPETRGLLDFADQCFELSNGLFDLTVGALYQVWSFSDPQLPDRQRLAGVLDDIGWKKVGWNGRAVHNRQAIAIDMGGLVKEFAVDRLVQILRERSIAGLVNLAGDIAASRAQPEDKPWTVAITHPRRHGAIAEVKLEQGALASSGDYERFIEVDGTRYCHLLRPDTGYPETAGFCSVSVIAEQCLLAGSVSTVAMLKGSDGLAWLDMVNLPYLAFDQFLNASGTIKV